MSTNSKRTPCSPKWSVLARYVENEFLAFFSDQLHAKSPWKEANIQSLTIFLGHLLMVKKKPFFQIFFPVGTYQRGGGLVLYQNDVRWCKKPV